MADGPLVLVDGVILDRDAVPLAVGRVQVELPSTGGYAANPSSWIAVATGSATREHKRKRHRLRSVSKSRLRSGQPASNGPTCWGNARPLGTSCRTRVTPSSCRRGSGRLGHRRKPLYDSASPACERNRRPDKVPGVAEGWEPHQTWSPAIKHKAQSLRSPRKPGASSVSAAETARAPASLPAAPPASGSGLQPPTFVGNGGHPCDVLSRIAPPKKGSRTLQ